MQMRRLKNVGLTRFRDYLRRLREDPAAPPPVELLDDPETSEPLHPPLDVEPKGFATGWDFAHWLHAARREAGVELPGRDAGFWSWLSLALFDQVCPAGPHGTRKANEEARYILHPDDIRPYYKHRLAGPYSVYEVYEDEPERVRPLLFNPMHQLHNTAYNELAGSPQMRSRATIILVDALYFDPSKAKLKHGCGNRLGKGTLPRLAKLLTQLSLTYDLHLLPPARLAAMLPAEFDAWRPEEGLFG